MLSRALALIWVAALLLPTAAGAQEPTPEELAEARIHFERARGFEDAGQYERAADEYLSAYALYPDPEFFFNVGRVYRLAGDPERALRYYERYLELDPEGRGAEAAQAQAEELRGEVRAGEPADRQDDPGGDRDDGDKEPADSGDEPDDAPRHRHPDPLDPSEGGGMPRESDGSGGGWSTMQIAGVTTGAVGVAALGASAVFGNRARTLSNEISAFAADNPNGEWTDEMLAKYDQGERANRTMYVLGGVGLAAVTTGAILYVVGADDGGAEPAGVAIAPRLTPDGAAVTLGGTF